MTLPSRSTLATDASTQDAASLVHFEPLSALWLDTLLPIEEQAYVHPWTRGNFQDAMVAGYQMQLLVDADHQLLGYFVAMQALDEVHLLNITVNPAGVVIGTSINPQTNTVNSTLRKAAEDAAKKARFNTVEGPNNQTGTITYYFNLR